MEGPIGFIPFLKKFYHIWIAERPTQLAAALAYYGMFSFAPVIYIAFTVAGIFLDQVSLMETVFARLEEAFGPEIVNFIQESVEALSQTTQGGSFIASLISFLALLLAASGMFFQLQFALNTIWEVPQAEKGETRAIIRQRLFSFLMVLAVGLLLIVTAFVGFFQTWIGSFFNLGLEPVISVLIFLGLLFISFALMYRILPDVKIAWKDVWPGALVASALVTIGVWLVITFVGGISFGSALEAAGTFAVILIAIYYISQIFLLGAVFTRVYAHMYGSMSLSTSESVE